MCTVRETCNMMQIHIKPAWYIHPRMIDMHMYGMIHVHDAGMINIYAGLAQAACTVVNCS